MRAEPRSAIHANQRRIRSISSPKEKRFESVCFIPEAADTSNAMSRLQIALGNRLDV
jgi:hypothetical protein